MRPFAARITHIEFSVPARSESHEDLLAENPDWDLAKIYEKTGVARRYLAAPEQTAADLCVEAAEKLFQSDDVAREDIDAVLLCTQSPDYALPTTACIIQDRLGLSRRVAAFDVNLGCSGFVYGLAIAGSMIEAGLSRNILLLCGDTYSKYIDAHDRTCRPIFSDAGTATLVQRSERRLLGPFELGTDGRGHRNLIVPQSGARLSVGATRGEGRLTMDGPSVFLFTIATVPEGAQRLVAAAGLTLDDIDVFFFHQASKLVLDAVVGQLHLPPAKVVRDLETIGNTVSATIPIALKRAVDAGTLTHGQLIMLFGFGVGYSWGGCLLRWEYGASSSSRAQGNRP